MLGTTLFESPDVLESYRNEQFALVTLEWSSDVRTNEWKPPR